MIVILADYVETVEKRWCPYRSFLWIMSSHEARTDRTATSVPLAFQWRFLAVPVCLYFSQIVAVHPSILFLIAMDELEASSSENFCLVAADGTEIAFPTVLMFFLVTQVRNCEDESRILNDLHRISRERKVLLRSIKVSRVEAVNGAGTEGNALGIA
ncbi:hypothetical protein T01_1170 [Trichinella spiralis]|uniref:Uncharacterized protein n=1 Tax=Trichinella spiralis TaxID=6334 RepID=A0A0V1B8P3_TRISP|nr:hypothetical protein T01_1170 [Trichinella spiralis]